MARTSYNTNLISPPLGVTISPDRIAVLTIKCPDSLFIVISPLSADDNLNASLPTTNPLQNQVLILSSTVIDTYTN